MSVYPARTPSTLNTSPQTAETMIEAVSRGMGPFRPNEQQTLKSYYEVPQEVLNDAESFVSWAREAIRAGQASQGPQR
jgi:TfoX/Sxy family transcriptional regulator of competence genes